MGGLSWVPNVLISAAPSSVGRKGVPYGMRWRKPRFLETCSAARLVNSSPKARTSGFDLGSQSLPPYLSCSPGTQDTLQSAP